MLFLVHTIDRHTHVMTVLFLEMAHRVHQDREILCDVRIRFTGRFSAGDFTLP